MPQQIKAASIQKHLEIKDIYNDVVVLKNNELRAILMTTSVNFALKSTEERDAVIIRYQDFLNSLDFSVQIMAASRRFEIGPYIQALEQKQLKQENELLKIQTAEYIDFVKGLTEMSNIMTESFYLVIPYSASVAKKLNFFDKLLGKKESTETKEQEFEEMKNNLWQRVEFVTTGLHSLGVKAVPLVSEELVELFYKLYNPTAKEEPELSKAKELRLE